MKKSTKEAWTGGKKISPEALEKRKKINSKIFKFGCLPIIIIFGLIFMIAIFSEDETEKKSKVKIENNNEVVEKKNIEQEKKIADSLKIVKKKNREEAKKLLKKYKVEKDEFEGNEFYKHPRTPRYANVNFIYPYIGSNGDNYWMRLKFQYASDDWLFINKAILLVDEQKFIVTGNWERDNNANIWEWLDIPVREQEEYILNKIANSKKAKVRYEGQQYHNDRTITRKEKQIIKQTLEIYKSLKN